MKNVELGKIYNHVEYLNEYNNYRPSVRSARFSLYCMSGTYPEGESINEQARHTEYLKPRRTSPLKQFVGGKESSGSTDKKALRRYKLLEHIVDNFMRCVKR